MKSVQALAVAVLFLNASFAMAQEKFTPKFMDVPSDSKATYLILDKYDSDHFKIIITKREGSSGVTYSKRMYDCSASEVRYLGTGNTLSELKLSTPDPKMTAIQPNSIAYFVGIEACK